MIMNWWMDKFKQTMVRTTWLLLNKKIEQITDTSNNMNEHKIPYAQVK